MGYGDIGSVQDSLEFDAADIFTPKIVHVFEDIYAIACQVADLDGWIYTVKVDALGAIPATVEASAEFEAEAANGIFFMHIAGNVFAVLTRVSWTELRLRTISISNDGKTITNIATRAVGAPDSDFFSMCKVAGSIYAVVYREAGTADGWVKTFTITDDGAISAELSDFEFDANEADFCVIIRVSDTVCAIAYASATATKVVTTIKIDGLGSISDIAGGPLTITTSSRYSQLAFCHTTGDAFAVAFQDASSVGWVKSILIDEDGVMTDPAKANLEFGPAYMDTPNIIDIGLGLCALVYMGLNNDGFVCTFTVDKEGNITEPTTHNLEFDTGDGKTPHIVHAIGDIYAIAYKGVDNDGWVCSLDISTPPVATGAPHGMMMGVYP